MPCTKLTFAGSVLFVATLTASASTQSSTPTMSAPAAKPMGAPASVVPTGLGEAIDRDVARLRAATARFKSSSVAIAEGYPQETDCVQHQPHGAMGYHFGNKALKDAALDVEKPEVLVYEKRPDGTLQLNGVEFFVPFTAWTKAEPPSIMGQNLKRAESLGFWYLHVWSESGNPSGLFADWNPNVKC
jgi:hypothetical protein